MNRLNSLMDKTKHLKNAEEQLAPTPTILGQRDWREYKTPKHIKEIEKRILQMLDDPKDNQLAISLPPRSGKSLYISTYFPAWYLAHNPDKRVILISHEQRLAESFSVEVKRVFEEYSGMHFRQDMKKKSEFLIEDHKGGLIARGMNSSITGRGGDLIIIDDPCKDHITAISQTIQEAQRQWYKSTLYTRRMPGAKIIVLGTRWSTEDLIGYLTRNTDEWSVINKPAFNSDGTSYWPEMWSIEDLNKTKETLGSFWFSAEYLGQPTPLEGGFFKRDWIKTYIHTEVPLRQEIQRITAWDFAVSTKSTADQSVGVTIDYWNGYYYVRDIRMGRLSYEELKRAIHDVHNRWKSDLTIGEDVGFQKNIIAQVNEENSGIHVKGVNPGVRNKEARLSELAPMFEAGKILFPDPAPEWLAGFLDEYLSFPTGVHDDILDALYYAVNQAKGSGNPYTPGSEAYFYEYSTGYNKRRGQRPKSVLFDSNNNPIRRH